MINQIIWVTKSRIWYSDFPIIYMREPVTELLTRMRSMYGGIGTTAGCIQSADNVSHWGEIESSMSFGNYILGQCDFYGVIINEILPWGVDHDCNWLDV